MLLLCHEGEVAAQDRAAVVVVIIDEFAIREWRARLVATREASAKHAARGIEQGHLSAFDEIGRAHV